MGGFMPIPYHFYLFFKYGVRSFSLIPKLVITQQALKMKSVVLMAPSIERLINLVNQLSSARCCILGNP